MSFSAGSYTRVGDGRLDGIPDASSELLHARGEHVAETLAAPTEAVSQ